MKITKQYLKQIIKEEITAAVEEVQELEEGIPTGAVAGTVLAAIMAMTGMSAYEATKRYSEIQANAKKMPKNYDELEQYFLNQGNDKVPENMDASDLALYKAGKEWDKSHGKK